MLCGSLMIAVFSKIVVNKSRRKKIKISWKKIKTIAVLKTCLGNSEAVNKYIIVGRHKRLLIIAYVPVTNSI